MNLGNALSRPAKKDSRSSDLLKEVEPTTPQIVSTARPWGRVSARTATVAIAVLAILSSSSSPANAAGGSSDAAVGSVMTSLLAATICAAAAVDERGRGATPGEFSRQGWLVGLGGSYALEEFGDDLEENIEDKIGAASLSSDDSFGIRANAGYRCHSRFSAEFEVEWLDSFDSDVSRPGIGKTSADVEALAITANIKGYLLTGRFQPFLRVGAGALRVDYDFDDEDGFITRFGGGIEIYATKQIVVNAGADYLRSFGDLKDFDFVSIGLGLEYRF